MKSINNQSEYWDSIAQEKTFQHPLDLKLFKELVPCDQWILDYGCGYGRTSKELWENGFQNVIGVDSSPKMIERGRKENPYSDLYVLSNSNLPFADESFHAVLLFSLLTCVPTNEGQRTIIQETSRVLRSGGLLYISDLPLQNDERNQQRYHKYADEFGMYGVFRLPEGAVCRHHEMEWIEALTSGFEKIGIVEIDVITMNKNPAKAFQYFGRKLC